MAVDPTKARELLDRAIELANDGDPDDFNGWRESARVALRVALGEDDPTLARFDQISYSPMMFSAGTPDAVFDDARRSGVKRATAMLAAVLTEVDVSQASAPGVDVQALHPWVAGMAFSLWSGGHHRQAVEEAARAIEVQLRAKLGLDGGTGAPLVTSAFSPKSRWLGRPPGRDEMIAVAVGAWSPWFLGASSPSKVWCGIRGTGECRFEHEPQILNRPWFPSDGR